MQDSYGLEVGHTYPKTRRNMENTKRSCYSKEQVPHLLVRPFAWFALLLGQLLLQQPCLLSIPA